MTHTTQEISDLERLKELTKVFFEEYLDYSEIHGYDEHVVHPISVTCCRALMIEPLKELLEEMRKIAC